MFPESLLFQKSRDVLKLQDFISETYSKLCTTLTENVFASFLSLIQHATETEMNSVWSLSQGYQGSNENFGEARAHLVTRPRRNTSAEQSVAIAC
jgi:hypothetical protein